MRACGHALGLGRQVKVAGSNGCVQVAAAGFEPEHILDSCWHGVCGMLHRCHQSPHPYTGELMCAAQSKCN